MASSRSALLGFFLILGLSMAYAQASCPSTSIFGATASAYNVFLLGGGAGTGSASRTLHLINGDVEGRTAVNGNLRGANVGFGTRLGECSSSSPTIVVGGYAS